MTASSASGTAFQPMYAAAAVVVAVSMMYVHACVRMVPMQADLSRVISSPLVGIIGAESGSVHKAYVNCVEFDADGAYMFTGDGHGAVVVWTVSDKANRTFGYKVRKHSTQCFAGLFPCSFARLRCCCC